MKRIADLCEEIDNELHHAKHCTEEYLYWKAAGNTKRASNREHMARDHLQAAMWVHDEAVEEIERLNAVYKPSVEMVEKWRDEHVAYVNCVEWIKRMLDM